MNWSWGWFGRVIREAEVQKKRQYITKKANKNHLHIEKLNLPCRYFVRFFLSCASFIQKKVYACSFADFLGHTLQKKRFCWFCGTKRTVKIIYFVWAETHIQSSIHACVPLARQTCCRSSSILCWHSFRFALKIINSVAIKQKAALNFFNFPYLITFFLCISPKIRPFFALLPLSYLQVGGPRDTFTRLQFMRTP